MAEKTITWYNRLKEDINGQIKKNGRREITGAKLNSVLNQMVDALGKNMTFGGVVSPATVIDNTDDNPVFYLALEAGNYPYCGNTVVGQGQIAFLFRDANNIWHQASWNAPDENFTTEEKEKLQGLPTEEELREALGAKANAPESKPGSDNLASFDEEGNLKDSGVSIPVPTEEEKEYVLSSGETGLEWVPKPVDGDDAYGVYVKEYKEGHGGSTDGMLTRPQWLLSLKGEKGDNAVNPFKGWFDSSDDIPTQGAKKGDYAYVTTSGVSVIWKHNGTAFENTNEMVSQEQTFNSNERLSAVKIDDTHLDNPVGDDETNAPTLAKAEDVMQLKAKLEGVKAQEVKVNAVVGNNVTTDAYVSGETGLLVTNKPGFAYFELAIPPDTKNIRFTTGTKRSGALIGYSIGNYDGNVYVPTRKFFFTNAETTPPSGIVEKSIEVLDGETVFMTTVVGGSTYTSITLDKFYCYLQIGKSVKDMIPEVVNAFIDDAKKALSAEKGKELHDRLIEVDRIDPILYSGKSFASVDVGETIAEPSEFTDSQLLSVRIFDVEGGKEYKLNGGWSKSDDKWLYFYVDENNVVLSRIWCTTLPHDDESTHYYYWRDFLSKAPVGAVKLYEKCYSNASKYDYYLLEDVYKQLLSKNDIANDWDGGSERTLSAEKGKELHDEAIGKKYIIPIKFSNRTFASPKIGDVFNENNFSESNIVAVRVFEVEADKEYRLNGGWDKNTGVYGIYVWTDNEDKVLGVIYSNSLPTSFETDSYRYWEAYKVKSPNGAVKLYEKCYNVPTNLNFYVDYDDATKPIDLRILALGNSYTQDSLAYVPFIMRTIAPNVRLTLGILHRDSASLETLYNFFDQNKFRFFLYEPTHPGSWKDFGDSDANLKSIKWGLKSYEWDIVLLNNSRRGNGQVPDIYLPLQKLILGAVGYPIRFGGIMTLNHPSSENGGFPSSPNNNVYFIGEEELAARFAQSCNTNQSEIAGSLCDFIFPVETAVMNAYTVDNIKSIGQYINHPTNTSGNGWLCYFDGYHLQDGLPCQLAAYTVIMGLLNLLGMGYKAVLGDTTKCDSLYLAGKGTPGVHGVATGYDDALVNVRFIQMCAVMAHKNPYEVSDMNEFYN